MVTLGERRDIKNFDSLFLVIPCMSVYNFILGRPFVVTMDAMASLIHHKLKYRDIHDEPTTIDIDLYGVKRIY